MHGHSQQPYLMSVNFWLSSGEHLTMHPDLPANYAGPVIRGATAFHTIASFGKIIFQEIKTNQVAFRTILIQWRKPVRIMCSYTYSPGLFTRTSLDHSLHEYIKGAGEIHVKKNEFSSLIGSSWKGLLAATKPGDHHFTDIHWSNDFFRELRVNDPELYGMMLRIYPGFPERIIGPVHSVDDDMRRLLHDLQGFDCSSIDQIGFLHERLKTYLSFVLRQSRDFHTAKRVTRKNDWNVIHEAKHLIDNNPDKHFTIPEISVRVGVNEFKLKKLFPKIVGLKVDEYRKYHLCVKAGKKIVASDEPVKSFYQEAGYTSAPSFIRGFRKILFCTPGELREDSWNLGGLPQRIKSFQDQQL